MFKSKASVDRHVQELFRKVKDEKERNLRCYNIAKLYYQVGDYESARRYVSSYLEIKGESSGAHKLLGQIHEALGQKEEALTQFQQSLELEPRQDDLVLKVCELLSDMETGLDINRLKYWVDRASEKFSHNPVIFKLKEKMLVADRSNGNDGDLEALIAAELSARPLDVNLRVKLLKHYMSKNRLDDAYKHALEVEATYPHRDSMTWYETLSDLFTKFKEQRQSKPSFWLLYISSLERYAALTLKEHGTLVKTIQDAALAVFNLDQALTIAKLQNYTQNSTFVDQMFNHMLGQLNYHFACLLIRRTKREQGNWSETGRLCSPLLLSAIHASPIDPTLPSMMSLKDQNRAQILIWHREGAYRVSQASHVLREYSKEDSRRLMDKIDTFCVGAWRERIYQRIFTSKSHIAMMSTSYFANNNSSPPALRLLVPSDVRRWDEISEEVNPASLHHHVWLGIVNKHSSRRNIESNVIYPNQVCHVFPGLQLSAYNLSQAAPDSIGRLDVDAFLNATILCSLGIVEEQQKSGFLNRDRMPTLPADTTNILCTINQEKWWLSAYKMYKKPENISGELMEIRQELQRGLEVIRCIGNHGLHINIIVHLAKIFHHRARELRNKDKSHADIPMLEARYELYWEIAVPLLERLINNQTIRSTSSKLFDYQGKQMNNLELSNALEEGRLILARKLLRDKQHEQAIDALQSLKCPEASYLQGEVYKTLADELIGSLPKESLTSAIRSQHVVLLAKARNCYYLTLDRLRSPGVNPTHPLNSELGSKISSIENDLKRIDPDLYRNDLNRNDCDVLSDESYSSAQSATEQPTMNSLNHGITINTPQRHSHRTPKQSSTPRHQHQDLLEHSRSRIQLEARPSPERLDAQIRQLVYAKDHVFQTILDQHKTLLESVKTLVESDKLMREKLEELRKEFSEFRKEYQQKRSARSVNTNQNAEDDYSYGIDDDYSEMNYTQPVGGAPVQGASIASTVGPPHQMPGNLFANQRHPYSPLVYPPPPPAAAAALPGYYQSGLPFNDPQAHHIPPIYSPSVYQMPGVYQIPPRAGPVDQGLSGMQPGIFQQGLFPNRLIDLVSPQTAQGAPLTMQMQNLDITRNEPQITLITQFSSIKDAPVNKAPPSNVVITTSDTVPTTVPPVQPTLSVTIPPHHRNIGSTSTSSTSTVTSTTTTTPTTSAPHNYQISMPSHATIPTTVNLPPLATSVTNTIAAVTMHEKSKNTSITSTGSHNSWFEAIEIEHDPIPDFQPVIPLPAEVKVTTGEEDEDTLFVARAKLFRFVEKEWKDRGVGNVKLLKNKEGRVRLLMRRDQVLKICANHMLTPEMELSQMPSNDKAWIWVANDFADEEVKLEKLCIKFKTVEDAQEFKKSFDEAKKTMTISPVKSKTAPTENENDSGKSAPVVVGGFSFTKPPIIQQPVTKEDAKSPKQKEQAAKPSPFAGFSFTKSEAPGTTAPLGFSFGKSVANDTKTSQFTTNTGTTPTTSTVVPVDTSKVTLRRPHATTLSQAATEYSGAINDDNEAVLFDKNAILMRSAGEGQWKDRGSGLLSLLLNTNTGKLRLLMRKSDNSKVCCNQSISSTIVFTIMPGSPSIIVWTSQELTKSGKQENYAVSFQDSTNTIQLKEIISSLQKIMCDNKVPLSNITKINNVAKISLQAKPQPSLAELFKPASGSWECTSCYTRNDAAAINCIACAAPSGRAEKVDTASSAPSSVPLSQLFKPPPDSWECKGCYMRNTKSNQYCVACDGPSDPSLPPKPQSSGFGLVPSSNPPTTAFTFGMPLVKDKEETSPAIGGGFQFGSGASGFSFKAPGVDEKSVGDTKGFTFQPKTSSTDFVFGTPQKLEVPAKGSFTFGSPGKSFDFQFSSKSPVKSPGSAGDVSEDEVPESEDVYFPPVIPLPEKIEVKTGEEDEQVLYTHRAKLFRYDGNTKEWKERGLGDIKLLKHTETKKLRLVMRREQTLKLCLNHLVPADLELTSKDEKTWLWNAADYSDGEIEYVQLACRFKTSEIAEHFKKAIEDALADDKADDGEEKNEKTSKSSSIGSAQEIQVIYERKVTDEEKEQALKLQLPENFYAYKQKEDCPGCIGCQEPDIRLFDKEKEESPAEESEIAKGVTTPMSVKLAPPKLTPPATTTSMIFGDGFQKLIFNSTATSTFGDQPIFGIGNHQNDKPVEQESGFVFGTSQQSDADATKNLFGTNVSICSPSEIKTPTSTINFVKSNYDGGQSILSGTAPSKTIFGGTGSFGMGFTGSAKSESSSTGANIFESAAKDSQGPQSFSNLRGTGSIFGGNSSLSLNNVTPTEAANKVSGSESSPFGSKLTFESLSGAGDNASGNVFALPKPPKNSDQKEDNIDFLKTDNSITFSALAATATTNAFTKKDANFSFAGAGQSVFGAKATNSSGNASNSNSSSSGVAGQKKGPKKNNDEDGDGEEDGENDGQVYDPHYEPIVPLPDAIEVKTGEEDEEKVFAERAKLYRYSTETKEWKERGVGEMKVLHHAGHGTYRLLLRREQIHNVVCNFLIRSDLELHTLNTTDCAWMWAGMNFAEEPPAVEELAVKFKNSELAMQFKNAVEKAKEDLLLRAANQPQIIENEEDAEDEGEDDEDIHSLMYENSATLMVSDDNSVWKTIGHGDVKVVYDSEIFGARIIFETMPGHIVCSTLISMETEMEIQDNCCVWTAIDYAFDPPTKRSFKLQFVNEAEAEDMLMNFKDGQECARQAGISEDVYYDENDDNDE